MQAMLERGRRALEAWSWPEARDAFEAELREHETAEALEGLATAAAWLDDATAAIAARERAYRLYSDRGDAIAAARAALGLADVSLWHRGEPAIAAGWLGRARAHVSDRIGDPIVASIDVAEGYLALAYDKDPARAKVLSERALLLARQTGDASAESLALAQLGLALVSSGEFADGMRRLDEATVLAVGGAVADREVVATVCCYMVTACARVRDGDRTAQWSQQVMDLALDWTNRAMFTYPRTEYAAILVLWGRWGEAERELQGVIEEMSGRPLMATVGLVRLADLRRRQGRLDDADLLLDRAEAEPYRGGAGPSTLTARAAVALDRGATSLAAELVERYLRAVPRDDRIERLDALAILVEALVARADIERADAVATEMAGIAAVIPTGPFRATALQATGVAAAARGDHPMARDALIDAAAIFDRNRVPFEAARVRLTLAQTLHALDEPDQAATEARRAHRALVRLGAKREAERAGRLVARLVAEQSPRPTLARLTRREAEVLRKVGLGRSNDEIAADLVLSVRTVERHLSNIYLKVGTHGRIARAVATSYAHTHGLM